MYMYLKLELERIPDYLDNYLRTEHVDLHAQKHVKSKLQ